MFYYHFKSYCSMVKIAASGNYRHIHISAKGKWLTIHVNELAVYILYCDYKYYMWLAFLSFILYIYKKNWWQIKHTIWAFKKKRLTSFIITILTTIYLMLSVRNIMLNDFLKKSEIWILSNSEIKWNNLEMGKKIININ